MNKICLGLAGAWHVHTRMYVASIQKVFGDKAEWLYVWEDNKERAMPLCEQTGARYIDDLQIMLDDPQVDAVICEAETCKHKEIIIRAAEAGKPVYTDKVLTISSKDAQEIKEVIDRTGVKFAVSHESLPVASYAYMKKKIEEGLIGDVTSMHFRRAHGAAKDPNGLRPDWFDKAVAGGGALIDLGIHGVSMLTHMCGTPKNISCYTHNFTGHETEDSATILVEFENGAIGTAHTDMTTSTMENNVEILGTEGILLCQGLEGQETLLVHSTKIPECGRRMIPVPPEEFRAEVPMNPVCQFIELVMDESNPATSLPGIGVDDGCRVVRMVEAAYESAATGRSIPY